MPGPRFKFRNGAIVWVMVAVLLLFLPMTFVTVRRAEAIGQRRDQAVALLRGRRALVLEMVRAAERRPTEPLSRETADALRTMAEQINQLGESEPGQRDTMDRVRIAIEGASMDARGPILGAIQPALDGLYARDQEIVDAFRLQFARVGIRGPYMLLALESLATVGLIVAATLVTREFRVRDRTERELLRSRERLAGAERLARLGHWELDWATRRVEWSDSLHEIYGVPREFFGGTLEDVLMHIHPDDRGRVRDSMADLASRPRPLFDQFRVLVEGKVRVVFQRGTPVLGEGGKLVRIFGTTQDVTDQTRAEQAIRVGEARFRALCDYAPLVIFQSRPDGTVTYISPRWSLIAGVNPDESLGWSWGASIHPDDRARVLASWREAAERSEPWAHEHRILRPDGVVRWLRVLASPIGEEGAEASGYVGTAEDVTERIEADRVVASARARFEAVIRASRQMLYDWNTATNRIEVEGLMEDFVGMSAAELSTLGGWAASVHPEDRALFDREIERVLATHEPFNLQYRLRRADGRYVPVHDHGHFVRGADGELHMLGLVADLSERRSLEAQLLHAQKMESIGRLAGGIAHDFNNWLTAIIGHVSLARSASRDPEILRALQQILLAAESAAGLTRQLVAFARRQVIEPVVCDPAALVQRARGLLDPLLGENIGLEVRASVPGLWSIRVDPAQIEQVLVNLAVNARDAMPAGGRLSIELSNVTVSADAARLHADLAPGEFVQIIVSDTGAGIPPDDLPRIFEPFFTTKEQGKGTGLGLSMVLGIVKQSGGHVWVYSEPGLGTTFKLYFPRARGLLGPDGTGAPHDEPATPSLAPAPLRTALPGETVLVVEDQQLVRELVCDVLGRRGYTVLSAPDGPEAERLASQHPGPIHLLLTDLVLPSTDGKRLAAALVAARPEMRVLLTSGYTDLRAGLEPGVNYLQKPYGPDTLTTTVRDVLDAPVATGPRSGGSPAAP